MAAAKSKTKTAGAVKGGEGTYHYRLDKVKKVPAGTGYSTAHGGVVEGARSTARWRGPLTSRAMNPNNSRQRSARREPAGISKTQQTLERYAGSSQYGGGGS